MLRHCGLIAPYVDTDLGKHWLEEWFVALRLRPIISINIDSSSLWSSTIRLRAILQARLHPKITEINGKINHFSKLSFKSPRVKWVNIVFAQHKNIYGNDLSKRKPAYLPRWFHFFKTSMPFIFCVVCLHFDLAHCINFGLGKRFTYGIWLRILPPNTHAPKHVL